MRWIRSVDIHRHTQKKRQHDWDFISSYFSSPLCSFSNVIHGTRSSSVGPFPPFIEPFFLFFFLFFSFYRPRSSRRATPPFDLPLSLSGKKLTIVVPPGTAIPSINSCLDESKSFGPLEKSQSLCIYYLCVCVCVALFLFCCCPDFSSACISPVTYLDLDVRGQSRVPRV